MTQAATFEAAAVLRRYDPGYLLFRRWLGTVIDSLVLGVAGVAVVALSRDPDRAVLHLGLFLTVGLFAYFSIAEGVWGRTLGKLAAGLIVVDQAGRPPGLWRAGLRTFMRVIEVNPLVLGGLPAAGVVALTEKRQRLGDILADTYVIPFKDLAEAADDIEAV